MLTPEERQRIEEEERYRAEVRSKLKEDSSAPVKESSVLPWVLGMAAAVIIMGAIIWSFSTRPKIGDDGARVSHAAPVPINRYVPVSQKIATGQIIVKANGYVQYRLTITPEMVEPTHDRSPVFPLLRTLPKSGLARTR